MICGRMPLATTAAVDAPSEYALTIMLLGTARATIAIPRVSVGEMPNAISAILKPSPVAPNTTMNSAISAVGGTFAIAVTIGEHIACTDDSTPIAIPSAAEIAMPMPSPRARIHSDAKVSVQNGTLPVRGSTSVSSPTAVHSWPIPGLNRGLPPPSSWRWTYQLYAAITITTPAAPSSTRVAGASGDPMIDRKRGSTVTGRHRAAAYEASNRSFSVAFAP